MKTKAQDTTSEHKQVGVRLSQETFEAVAKHLARMKAQSPAGVELKLADAIRNLVALGLDAARTGPASNK